MKGYLKNAATPDRTSEWARRAYEMLASFPTETAGRAAAVVSACYERGGKVLACGNGGSASEAQHLVTELVGKFERNRASLPALALDTNSAALTAISNDYGYDDAFAHQVDALGDPDEIELLDGVVAGLLQLREAGYRLVLVSNQSGVARGYFDEAAVDCMHDRLQRMLDARGAALDDLEYCPHHPEGVTSPYTVECACRKPAPGMLRRAARKHGVNLSASWMVGDVEDDVEAGRRAGARTVLVGPERSSTLPDFRAENFAGAVSYILEASGSTPSLETITHMGL